ncbi:MAG: 5'/3'-nucleotidase SurE [Chlamydiales bacterium]
MIEESMMHRPSIILTNDDGIEASGIKALWDALHEANFADLFIVAPLVERSGTGVSITWDRPMLIQERQWPANTPAWSVDGTPADCIKMGMRILLKKKPDFIISGINAGSNAGRNVLHSGTIGGVIEGVLRGIPGIAFSCEDGGNPNFHVAKKYIIPIVRYLMEYPLPPGNFLNVNFPQTAKDKVKGFHLTSQGRGRWSENPYFHIQTDDGPSYWLGGKSEELAEEKDCDIALLKQGYLTAVPIQIQELTNHHELNSRKKTFEDYLSNLIE